MRKGNRRRNLSSDVNSEKKICCELHTTFLILCWGKRSKSGQLLKRRENTATRCSDRERKICVVSLSYYFEGLIPNFISLAQACQTQNV